MENFYKINLTDGKKIYFKELNLIQYKSVQKMCVVNDHDTYEKFLKDFLNEISYETIDFDLNYVDIFLCWVGIYYNSVSDVKKFKTWVNGKEANISVDILELSEKILEQSKNISKNIEFEVNGIDGKFEGNLLSDNFIKSIKNDKESLIITPEFLDVFPLNVKKKVDIIAENIRKKNTVKLFSLYNKEGSSNNINFHFDKGFVYSLISVFIKDDLLSFYKNIHNLKQYMGISYDDHKFITYSEMGLYVNLFNKQKEEENKKLEDSKVKKLPRS